MKFKNSNDFMSAVLKNPAILIAGSAIVIGSQLISPVKAQQISNYAGLTPTLEKNGVSFFSTTFNQKNTLLQSFEARYGSDFKNKYVEGRYNLGLSVGSNTLLFDKRPVTDKLFEQVNLAANISKFLGKEINLKIGFDKKLNNYKLEGFNIVEASKGSRVQSSLAGKKVTGAISLNFNNGKLTNYSGIAEVNFTVRQSRPFTAALGFYSVKDTKLKDTKLKDMYWQIRGTYNIKGDKSIFMPGIGAGFQKGKAHLNLDVIFVNKGNKLGILSVINPSNLKEHGILVKYGRYLTQKPKNVIKEPKARSNLFNKSKIGRKGRK